MAEEGPASSGGGNDGNPENASAQRAGGDVAERPESDNKGSGFFEGPGGKMIEIRDVWNDNLHEELRVIRDVVEKYPFVAMDTEFPGVVARPIGDYNATDYNYQTLRCNVDLLKIIQLGISFCDAEGKIPDGCPCWQFNFKFSLSEDMYAQDSIELLTRSGINFEKHESNGIDVQEFGELLMTSGLVLQEEVKWISFHSGYDFGYLVKLLTCAALPADETAFFELLHTYFPCIFDIKYLMACLPDMHGGLQKLADDLNVPRIGPMHQAGSDSLMTTMTFFKLVEVHYNDDLREVDDPRYIGEIYGLGGNHTAAARHGGGPTGP